MPRFASNDADYSDYALVADRITLFYQRYPLGRIITRLHSQQSARSLYARRSSVDRRTQSRPRPAGPQNASVTARSTR